MLVEHNMTTIMKIIWILSNLRNILTSRNSQKLIFWKKLQRFGLT